MKQLIVTLMIVLMAGLIGCGGAKKMQEIEEEPLINTRVQLPVWYIDPPQDKEFYREKTTYEHPRMDVAELNARKAGMAKIVEWVRVEANTSFDNTMDERGYQAGVHESFENVISTISSEQLVGVGPSPGHYDVQKTPEGMYVVYMLMQIPRDQAKKAITDAIAKDNELLEKFISDGVMEKFKDKLAAYKESKN